MDFTKTSPNEVRKLIRSGKIKSQTSGMCHGYAQANLVVLPKEYAYDFLLFTQRNPKSCPVLEVTNVGSRMLKHIAKNADIATDIPKYRIYENGNLLKECSDVSEYWRDDFVSFLIGCSFSFESELLEAGISVRHIEENKNVPMFITNIDCIEAGAFHGKMVVSMRPMTGQEAIKAISITSQMPRVHGTPIHFGNTEKIGIKDINKPDFGDAVTIKDGEIPVFWCCGVTPQSAVMTAKPSFAITHSPGHMLITDIKNASLKD